ncbi:MAG: alpha/beta hydrolase family protein, partial [Acutalibacteraceae bacterium]
MEKVHENLIKVTHYEEWGKLPNPFVFNDGTPLKNPEEWGKRREEIFTTAVELQYGTIPPSPEVLEISRLNYNANFPTGYRITAGTKQQTLSFVMRLFLPEGDGPFPLVVDGDLCFKGPFHQNFVKTFTDRGIGVVLFDRTELVPDPANSGIGRVGPLYEIYPDYTFGSIAAWAWGYSRCVDALEKCNFRDKIDFNYIAFTGHSRGGKTAMLAGVLDER